MRFFWTTGKNGLQYSLTQVLISFDANGTPEDKSSQANISALEIAAITANEEAFKLLALHCKVVSCPTRLSKNREIQHSGDFIALKEESKKKLANLVLVGLREKTPSIEFKTLFDSIPLSEVIIREIVG